MELNNNVCKAKQKNVKMQYLKNESYLVYAAPIFASLICYLNSLHGEFLHDDIHAIVKNGDVTGKTSAFSLFSHDFWGNTMWNSNSHKSYRPLCVLTFRLNHVVAGLNPITYHIINVILHGLATGLLTLVCLSVLRLSTLGSLIAGTLFALHPIHTEAVSGIVGRADILSSVFFLLSFLSYVRSTHPSPLAQWCPKMFITSLCLSVCSMLSKETGITAIGVNILYDAGVISNLRIKRSVQDRKYLKECGPFCKRFIFSILTLLMCMIFRMWIMGWELPSFLEQDNPAAFAPSFLTRFLTYNYLVYFNVQLILAPITQSYDWQIGSIPLVENIGDFRNFLTGLQYFVLSLIALSSFRKVKGDHFRINPSLFGMLMLCLPFIPASHFFFRVGFVVAERLLYIPSMGFCILVAYGYTLLAQRFPRLQWALTTVMTITMVTLFTKTFVRNMDWISRESLFRSGLMSVPSNAKVYYNYANYLIDEGFHKGAVDYSRKAIELYPKYAMAWNNLGTLVSDQIEAERCYREALRHHPEHIPAFINLGSLLFQQGNTHEGLSLLRKAESIDPHDPQVCIMLGSMLGHLGETTEAGKYFRKAIKEKPGFADAYNNYGAYLQQTGHYSEAVENYRLAVSLDGGHIDAMTNAAQSLRHLGRLVEAEDILKQAVDMKQSAVTLDKLGKFYLTTGQPKKALNIYRKIENKLLNSSDVTGLLNYATVLVENDLLTEAERMLTRVLQVKGEDVTVLRQMSNLYGLLHQHDKGVEYIDKAINAAILEGDRTTLSQLHFARASHLKDMKDYEKAMEAYLDSLSINKDQPKAHLNLGAIYHMKHDLKLAKHHYTETLKLNPTNRIARDNLEKLEKLASKKKAHKPG